MKTKNFIITSIAIIVVIGLLTSYATFMFLKGLGGISGRAGQEGSLTIGGLDTGGTTNVIIVDGSLADLQYEYGIPGDAVSFTATRGQSYRTDNTTISTAKPFLIRNTGTLAACITLYANQNPFDQTPTNNPTDPSTVFFWVAPGAPISGGTNDWDKVDNCGTNCFKTTDNKFPGDTGTGTAICTVTPALCLNLLNAIDSGNAKRLIDNTAGIIKGLQKDKPNNEAFLHTRIYVSNIEGVGSKSAIIRVTGYDASGAACTIG